MNDITHSPRQLAGSWVALLAAAVACLSACGEGSEGTGQPAAEHRMAGAVSLELHPQPDDRSFETLQDFVDGYWARMVPPQGDPPESWSDLEASLQPEDCATCHPAQYEDWRTTVHSGAYSPGLSGQLVNWEQASFGTVQSCLVCHAPLSEQSARLPSGEEWLPNPAYDQALRDHGVVCASCHVRGNRRHGPPRRDGSVDPSPEGSPHGGVSRTEFFEDSRFCAGCHQFGPGGAAPNGKPLENTFAEWADSRYAEEGVSCQSCHMPDRQHLWRGIHDPGMVRSGITIEWLTEPTATRDAGLRITNTGTGHRFPTYATPLILVRILLLDEDREAIDGTMVQHEIARRIAYQGGAWVELSDTRLAPDSAVIVSVPFAEGARHARAEISVQPDAFYREVFEMLLAGMLSDTSSTLLSEARRRADSSPYILFDEIVPLTQ
ncbi:MAG: multiheme c-type cytochrome [Gemmatimonadota bacterium]